MLNICLHVVAAFLERVDRRAGVTGDESGPLLFALLSPPLIPLHPFPPASARLQGLR